MVEQHLTRRQKALRRRLGRHPAEVIRELVETFGKTYAEAGAEMPIPVSGPTAWRWLDDYEKAEQANGHHPQPEAVA